ncbi:MAG: beta-lactamase family protein [Gemmatimonadaceae bacterium]|nr:beta-lactamase family protein [Gemmatimonadaceae bacterium]
MTYAGRFACALLLLASASSPGLAQSTRKPDALDSMVAEQMQRRDIVGLSLAIIDSGRIVDTRSYGFTTRGGRERVTASTLFQAGSISKPVAALAALQLVDKGAVSLDANVNDKLTSWRVPDNEFTQKESVTLRRLLSHTAGLTVHGFPGYPVTARVPSTPDVLDGKGNTPAVRVNVLPGSIWRYSGGGYTVMQQLVADVTGAPFASHLEAQVLKPLGMVSSSFAQPLSASMAARTATAHRLDRRPVVGRWHVYPEMAAAGLWTTPSDLARYAIGVQQMMAGKSSVLSTSVAKQMLTEQKGGYGLGPAVADTGATLRFSHNGRDEGFDASLIAYAHAGHGVVVMINANDNSRAVQRIIDFIALRRGWPAYRAPAGEAVTTSPDAPKIMATVAGRYEFQNNNMLTLFVQDGKLFTDVNGLPDEEWVVASDGRVVSKERPAAFKPTMVDGAITGITLLAANGSSRPVPRVGPLFVDRATTPDADTAMTARVTTALGNFAKGGDYVRTSPVLTEGARSVFGRPSPEFADVRSVSHVTTESVAGRGIIRHGHAIVRVIHYRIAAASGTHHAIVLVDDQNRVADFDLVSR